MITFRSLKDKYLGPNEPEAGSVLVANVLTRSCEEKTELESKEVQIEQDGFDDNVQKVKKQLIEPEMLGRL